MQKSVTGMSANRGFTLIEILIVIVIIGITVSFAMLAFGDFGQERRILFAAEQLRSSLRLAQEQSILKTATMGVRIDNTSYQIVKFQESSGWSNNNNKGIYKTVLFPNNTVINLKTDHKPKNKEPEIIINTSGDMTPFTLVFGSTSKPVITTLTGSLTGSLSFKKASSS